MPFYRNILKQALKLTWRNKYLWWFGIFAILLGNAGELEILFSTTDSDPSGGLLSTWQTIASTGLFSFKTLANIGNLLIHDTLNMMVVLLIILFILVVLAFLAWLVVVSQAAIVNNSAALLNKKNNTFRDGLDSGRLNFWPVLSINILVKAVVYILLLATISLPLIFSSISFGAILFYIIIFIITIPLAIILSFIGKYAIAYVVINKSKAGPALKQGWQLFKANWLISLEMAIILFIIYLLVCLAVILAILALAVPFVFLGMIFYYAFSIIGAYLIAAMALVCFLFIVISGAAALSVFQITSWTSLFLELNKNRGASKLVRLVNSVVSK